MKLRNYQRLEEMVTLVVLAIFLIPLVYFSFLLHITCQLIIIFSCYLRFNSDEGREEYKEYIYLTKRVRHLWKGL